MRISLPLYRLPALIVATALAAILISWRDTVPMKPVHPSGFTVGTLGPCDLPMPPPDDRDPAIFLRVRGHDDLYYSWGELPGSDHRVGLDQLDKLLSDIFTTRANRALFITFQGGTYEDLIHVIDAFLDVPPRLSPTLPLFCTELDRFGDKLESPRVFLLTGQSEREMVEHYGRCRVGPIVPPKYSDRPAIIEVDRLPFALRFCPRNSCSQCSAYSFRCSGPRPACG